MTREDTPGKSLLFRLLIYAGVIAAVLGAILLKLNAFSLAVGAGQPESWALRRLKAQVYASIPKEDEEGFKRLDPDDPGGWLSAFKEYPQPLENYRKQAVNRPTQQRRVIVLQPLGPMTPGQDRFVELLRGYVEVSFQLPCRVEKPLAPTGAGDAWLAAEPSNSWRGEKVQAVPILRELLMPRLAADAVADFGITMADLKIPGLNFVFGIGSYEERVGVYSLCRFFPEFWQRPRQPGDELLALRRACKVIDHELGHVFGLSHCVFYKCVMNGSNSLPETDEQPMHFCPVCHRKLLWNLGFDSLKRYRERREFYQHNGLTDEARWLDGRISRWEKVLQATPGTAR